MKELFRERFTSMCQVKKDHLKEDDHVGQKQSFWMEKFGPLNALKAIVLNEIDQLGIGTPPQVKKKGDIGPLFEREAVKIELKALAMVGVPRVARSPINIAQNAANFEDFASGVIP
ncbi:hypothetical protein CDL15_Pgr006634 [Punica granatum]|uniref:Uncharacterized protein n=1 Tax=Punica granatum TaxID=22663 RepID=A0A218X6N4_PUNGR|nr:hypothetical protein CDL15_Pgr006634 [Punica granatum]PKI33410.1 hypothetical protein CRG98_046195 [Punica granatum]